MHNSTISATETYGSFVALQGATITVVDTDHTYGSGSAYNPGSLVRAYKSIEILGARWKNGNPITEGTLVLENVTALEYARFDLANMGPQNIVAWEVDSTTKRTSRYLYPAIYLDDQGFRGDRLDMQVYSPQWVELVDDYLPSVTLEYPEEGKGINRTTFIASGGYDELGSGVLTLERSLDGGAFEGYSSYHDGTWTLAFVDLAQGSHTLTFRAIDKVSNIGASVTVDFVVDSVKPFLDIPTPLELVNTTTVAIGGNTEAYATMTIGGVVVPIDEDGNFSHEAPLKEGANTILVSVVDRAGNSNSTSFAVERDMVAPILVLTGPDGDVWTNALFVYGEGMTEDGADLRVEGTSVPFVNGVFKKRVDLEAGTFTIVVSATDRAGNMAIATVTLFVDWMAPALIIVEPEGGVVVTRDSVLYISGDVADSTIKQVLIKDQLVDLTSGRFVKQFTLLEGLNEYRVSIVDAAGNTNVTTVVAIRDLTPPTYEATLTPLGGELVYIEAELYSTAPAVELHMTINEVANVRIEGGAQLEPTTDVTLKFDLVEGINDIVLYIVDGAGNPAQTYRQRVTVDTTEPAINILSPSEGARTKEDTAVIHGITEEGSTVQIDGQPIALLSGGEFRRVMALVDGRNDYTISVVDSMGNSNSTTVSVLRESEVKVEETSTTGATVMGFVLGIVVGVVLALAFVFVRGRQGASAYAPAPSQGPISGAGKAPGGVGPGPGTEPSADGTSEGKGGADWEEY